MVSDFLTKHLNVGAIVWDIFRHGSWEDGRTRQNIVQMKGLEFTLENPTVRAPGGEV